MGEIDYSKYTRSIRFLEALKEDFQKSAQDNPTAQALIQDIDRVLVKEKEYLDHYQKL